MENKGTLGEAMIRNYISRAVNERGFTSEDIVGIFSPLFIQLERIHANGQVALTRGLESFELNEHGRLHIDESLVKESIIDLKKINAILPDQSSSFDIVAEQQVTTDITQNLLDVIDSTAADEIPDKILAPIFIPSYKSFESLLGHHDAQTDLHVLGMIMASLAMSVNLEDKSGVRTLDTIVKSPAYASNVVHPNILRLIIDLVQLDRRKRIRDAYSARIRLENYLEYSAVSQEDFDDVLDQYTDKEGDRNKWILSKLRNRLFDLSRRNRLIYFKKSSRYVNLTLSSVPYVLDYKNIRPEKLFIWNDDIESYLKKGGKIKLNKFLKIKENPQIATSLKKVYYEANRDEKAFGFNQLKLAFCFLNWYNYKENASQKIQSPLLLIPASVKKKKGINDEFTLDLLSTEAQVNPVLSYYLKELFDIRLPKNYDLSNLSIDDIYADVNSAILRKSNEVQLALVKKPRLRLIHSLAKRSFESYQKKVRKATNRSIWGGDGNYSYDNNDYRPLGLKLYRDKVRAEASVLEFLIDSEIKMNQNAVEVDAKRELYQIESDGSIDPFKWEFDLCNFTLGNFNYQRMTLVNDYDSMVDEKIHNEIFEALFSRDPREDFQITNAGSSIKENYCVIPADPTQMVSIQKAKEGKTYIIQGPPGTGKSQTIANLMASKVAEGKTILFISEKRAALDVVYARMSQIGLKDICTLIHDSQTDKKTFIFDVKETYEKYSEEKNTYKVTDQRRSDIIAHLNDYLSQIESYHSYQTSGADGIQIRQIIETLMTKGFDKNAINPKLVESAPSYPLWVQKKEDLVQIQKAINDNTKYTDLVSCPYLYMSEDVVNNSSQVTEKCNALESDLRVLKTKIQDRLGFRASKISDITTVVEGISAVKVLHTSNLLGLLDRNSDLNFSYQNEITQSAELKIKLSQAQEKTKNWRRKPTKEELRRLYSEYEKSSSGFFNKLMGKKSQFVDKLSEFFDFDAYMIPPEPEEIFRDIQAELELQEKVDSAYKTQPISNKLGNYNLSEITKTYQELSQKIGHQNLLQDPGFVQVLSEESELSVHHKNLLSNKNLLIPHLDDLDTIYDAIDDIKISAPSLFALAPRIREWFEIPQEIRSYIKSSKLSTSEIEYASAYNHLLMTEMDKGADITGSEISRIVEKIAKLYPQLLKINSELVVQKVKKNFQDSLDLNYIPSYELTKEQTTKKKAYHEGRAVLENEFNKKIRYKSIRDLADGDTGIVIKDLKPIWMMSPLSVSDALPLEGLFDIVIFDEASQITVEEGVPPLFRAHQAIIVGDEMQMPPSDFFSTKVDEGDDDAEFLSMDAESLLNQGARKLPQVTLGWHYRSRQEALINFSNFAFYHGDLMSIPDAHKAKVNLEPIEVFEREDATQNTPKLLSNSITYHYLPNGEYFNRQNDSEADYIAYMVRELLLGKSDKSVGIVAFSMQQQSNIETSLSNLAELDKDFAVALDDAYAGDDEEEFTGLFVKNLENVQGDERDIMILSICYGYSPKGRMLMNFGPINRRGGEKRLNVIFSRAKHHMAVVASIKHTDIKNESNEGANYLKKYLQYSELISTGHHDAAMSILNNLGRRSSKEIVKPQLSILSDRIGEALKSHGYKVDKKLGQSRLKIDLGIKKTNDQTNYDLGIIVDHQSSYESSNILNEYYGKGHILEVFGWKIFKVYASDWLKNKNLVLRAIIQAVDTQVEPEIETVEPKINSTAISKKIHLEHQGKGKFWNIERSGLQIKIEMGDIGESPVSQTQFFDDDHSADEFFNAQISSRKDRGFTSSGD